GRSSPGRGPTRRWRGSPHSEPGGKTGEAVSIGVVCQVGGIRAIGDLQAGPGSIQRRGDVLARVPVEIVSIQFGLSPRLMRGVVAITGASDDRRRTLVHDALELYGGYRVSVAVEVEVEAASAVARAESHRVSGPLGVVVAVGGVAPRIVGRSVARLPRVGLIEEDSRAAILVQ